MGAGEGSASAVAETDVVAYRLSREAFGEVSDHDDLRTRSHVLAGVARTLAARILEAVG